MDELYFRFAQENDVSTILYFIKELAAYEKMSDEVVLPGLESAEY